MDLRKAAAIVGVNEHPTRYAPDKTRLQMLAETSLAALEDAGLTMKEVDGFFSSVTLNNADWPGYVVADYLNINPRVVDTTYVGGSSFEFQLNHALSMIATGKIRVALIAHANRSRSVGRRTGTGGRSAVAGVAAPISPVPDSFEDIFGTTTVGQYALVAQRHMHQYGTTSRQLAEIAVAMRKHASLNPNAMFRDPIAVEDVVSSSMISTPLHLLDCCVISDGGGAVVVVSPEVARDCRKKPVWILAAQESIEHPSLGKHDFTFTCARRTGPLAMQEAGVTHEDVDMAMIYDSFTITVLCTLEDLGFCQKGEGGDFVSGGRLQLGGQLPINTDGGGLSSNHPGMRGIFLLIEGAIQARGEGGPRQVPGCRVVLCHATGGSLGTRHGGATVILASD